MGKEKPLKKGDFAVPITQIKQWSTLLLVGVVVVLFLSQLPTLDERLQQRRQSVAVFQPNKAHLLTDANLVDALSRLSLQDQILRVGWDHAILTVDLMGTVPNEVWADMRQLIVF